ncbi:glycoside hydrolase family 75 protein [Undibacterium flavidum]|uniref:Chitosanase (Glycosyl hydrolase group 75) n=1 Tax=Undibacterium flavidum TaxID=2762297 RepID=A0ABR6Y9M2_9BURK|nr:glycoside hydrolase family 75 protein [Undibacterium flavidum]MBC3873305.1 hypothetical protein [Undibacterium flavidum]
MIRNFLTVLLATATIQATAAECGFSDWSKYQDTKLYKHNALPAYLFHTSSVKVDADGAPNAYHPDDTKLHCTKGVGFKGLDCPANAGYPNQTWWPSVLVIDTNNPSLPYIQKAPSEFAGFFVSQTSLFDASKEKNNPERFVDSRNIPYLVFPREFHKLAGTGSMGDFGYATNLTNGKTSAFIVAEIGPRKAKLGEMSIALATSLGGENPNPRTGAGSPKGKFLFVVFPKSKTTPSWPLTSAQIAEKVKPLILEIGGSTALDACK